jgi:hypothetical protein
MCLNDLVKVEDLANLGMQTARRDLLHRFGVCLQHAQARRRKFTAASQNCNMQPLSMVPRRETRASLCSFRAATKQPEQRCLHEEDW